MVDENRTLTKGNSAALVPSDALHDLEVELYNRLNETSAALALGVRVIDTPNGNPWPVVTVNAQGGAKPTAENRSDTETGDISFSVTYLGAHKTVSAVQVSNEVWQDTYVRDFKSEIAELLADAVARHIDPLIFNGTAANQPRGFVQDLPTITVGANPNPEQLHEAFLSLDSAMYREFDKLRWGMHRDVYVRCTSARFGNSGAPAAIAVQRAMSDEKPLRLWGVPVVLTNDLSAGTANGDRIAVFGHFGRAVRGRRYTSTAESALTRDAFVGDFTSMRSTTRFDSRVVDPTAARALVIG